MNVTRRNFMQVGDGLEGLLLAFFVAFLLSLQQAMAQDIQNWDSLAIEKCQKLQPQALDCQNALVGRNISNIHFDSPLVIEKGGVYSGAWKADSPRENAVTILTSEPVIIKDSILVGKGNLIYGRNINLDIQNVSGFGLGSQPGKFLDATADKYISVTGSRMSNLWGMRVSGAGKNRKQDPKITFAKNISYNLREGLENRSHFIQFSNGVFPSAEIYDNISINAPWESHVEDVISIYGSGGTKESPILVYNNKIIGAYPPDPSVDSYSGGGILVDGGRSKHVSQYVIIRNNLVVSTTNYGIAIASGNNNTITNNIIFSSGMAAKNMPTKAQNIGVYIWNINKQPKTNFYNNYAYNNKIFWLKGAGRVNNSWLPGCGKEKELCRNHVYMPEKSVNKALAIEKMIIESGL